MRADPGLTGDPHTDARLSAWRPSGSTAEPLDRLPTPGRERRVRVLAVVLGVVVLVIAVGYLVAAVARAVPAPG